MRRWGVIRASAALVPCAAVATLCALLVATSVLAQPPQQTYPPNPCQTFTAPAGEPADVEAIKRVILELVDAYRGSARSPARVLRLVDPTHFVWGYAEFERALTADFELLQNRQLVCRTGTLSIQDDVAVLQSHWEKIAFLPPGLERIDQRADVRIQFTRLGPETAREWKITGLLGDFFGTTRTGLLSDPAVATFAVPALLPLNRPVTLTALVENRGAQPIPIRVLVRFYDVTDPARPFQLGGDQVIRDGLRPRQGTAAVGVTTTFTVPGPRRFMVVLDPVNQLRELSEQNNRSQASSIVGSNAVLTVIPGSPVLIEASPPAFTANVTIRLVDLDQAGKRRVTVRLQHRMVSGPSADPAAFARDEERIELTETGSPGTFVRSGVPGGKFDCTSGGTLPFGPASNNGRLEFPVFVSADCFGAPGTVTGQFTAIYVDPADAQGRVNVEVRATATFSRPVPLP